MRRIVLVTRDKTKSELMERALKLQTDKAIADCLSFTCMSSEISNANGNYNVLYDLRTNNYYNWDETTLLWKEHERITENSNISAKYLDAFVDIIEADQKELHVKISELKKNEDSQDSASSKDLVATLTKRISEQRAIIIKMENNTSRRNIWNSVLERISRDFGMMCNKITVEMPLNDGTMYNWYTGESRRRTKNDYYTFSINAKIDQTITSIIPTSESPQSHHDAWKFVCQFLCCWGNGRVEGRTLTDDFCIMTESQCKREFTDEQWRLMTEGERRSARIAKGEELVKFFISTLARASSGDFKPDCNQFFMIMTGEGKNGKSVMAKILQNIFGGMMETVLPQVFLESGAKVAGSSHTRHLIKLDKLRIGYLTELPKKAKLTIDEIRALTGGDSRTVADPFSKETRQIDPTAHPLIFTNDVPIIPNEPSITRRWLTFLANAEYITEGGEQRNMSPIITYNADPMIIQKATRQEFTDAFFTMLAIASREYATFGYNGKPFTCINPPSMALNIKTHSEQSFSFSDFVSEVCETGKIASSDKQKHTEVYLDFCEWFRLNNPGSTVPRAVTFHDTMRAQGYSHSTGGDRKYNNLRVIKEKIDSIRNDLITRKARYMAEQEEAQDRKDTELTKIQNRNQVITDETFQQKQSEFISKLTQEQISEFKQLLELQQSLIEERYKQSTPSINSLLAGPQAPKLGTKFPDAPRLVVHKTPMSVLRPVGTVSL